MCLHVLYTRLHLDTPHMTVISKTLCTCLYRRAGLLCSGCDCVDCYNDGKHEDVSPSPRCYFNCPMKYARRESFRDQISRMTSPHETQPSHTNTSLTLFAAQERLNAVEHIKTSDPLAFGDKVRTDGTTLGNGLITTVVTSNGTKLEQHIRGCKCKNSRCQKK
jgi:hypothetical protein